jgi:hypothetical protein
MTVDGNGDTIDFHHNRHPHESRDSPHIFAYVQNFTLQYAVPELTLSRDIPIQVEQMVLSNHDRIHRCPQHNSVLLHTLPMLVSCDETACIGHLPSNNAASPVSTYWEIFKYIGKAKCLNVRAIYYYHATQNTFSDFVIFLWPAKDLLNVKISRRQRITLTCMFSLGIM